MRWGVPPFFPTWGTPSFLIRDTHPSWWGTLILPKGGTPDGGYTHPSCWGRVPLSGPYGVNPPPPSGLDGGTPVRTGWGKSSTPIRTGWVISPSRIGWGYLLVRTGWGYLPYWDWMGFPPPLPGDTTAGRALATQQTVCLMRSRRRTFLFNTPVRTGWGKSSTPIRTGWVISPSRIGWGYLLVRTGWGYPPPPPLGLDGVPSPPPPHGDTGMPHAFTQEDFLVSVTFINKIIMAY